ncbi:MAG: ATP-binding cassette domain-containing protein [Tannerellaceae bacterium]|jgi:cell division transport system ATP-binding protein|nr:ATP-binding cassette domain-containing protein [Tannerellaceae bacterium]
MEEEELIRLEGVRVCRDENVILRDVDFVLHKGEYVYVIGKVGSGKSSLIKSLYREIPIKQGKADVLGYDLCTLKRREVPFLRRKLGIIFQDFQLLTDRSVARNLEFVLKATGWKRKNEMEAQIENVLLQVGMSNKGYKMPHELSGGEQQRIVIARALLNDPGIILADEPTGHLDPETGGQIVQLLHDISHKGTAVIMATHNYALVQNYPARLVKCEDETLSECTF